MKRTHYKKAKKRASTKRLVIKISLLLTLSAFIVVVAYGVALQKKVADAADRAYVADSREKSELRDEVVEPATDNVSILFIGIDESETRKEVPSSSLSDALIVATLNNKAKTVKLLSIPRDSYVYIPDRGRKDKITHAHGFGGTRGTIETVEGMLDIPIDYYVKMNFNAFIDVVDAFDGIDVEVPYDHVELDENDNRTIHLEKGMQHLDGRHALALARTRKLDNDIERGKRQQMILQAIMEQATSVKSMTKYGDVIDAVGDNMKTNMTFNEMKSFFAYVKGGLPEFDTLHLTGVDSEPPGTYYWLLDEDNLDLVKGEIQTHLEVNARSSALTDGGSNLSTPSTPDESANEGNFVH